MKQFFQGCGNPAYMTFEQLDGPGFGLMSPASKSKMKRRKGGRAGGIDIDDEM